MAASKQVCRGWFADYFNPGPSKMISLKMAGLLLYTDPLLPWSRDKDFRDTSELPLCQGHIDIGETGWSISPVGRSPGLVARVHG